MRILWFSNTPSLYDTNKHFYHGCGWVESLEGLLKEQEGIELAVSFFHPTDFLKTFKDGTTYFPILKKKVFQNPVKKLMDNWKGKIETRAIKNDVKKIIDDYQPDLIQIFGTEGDFSQVEDYTQIPVIYHIQGLINPCMNAYFPNKQSKSSFHLNIDYLPYTIKGNNPYFGYKRFKKQALREKNVLRKAKYVMGRTHWDKMLTELYNPGVQYFHVEEVLRPKFYQAEEILKNNQNQKFKIISTLSPTLYKGIDVVLKTAKKMQELTNLNFQWEIIGLAETSPLLKHFEKTEKINHQEVNIICSGRKTADEMIELMRSADVFVHPSYIDNSPNSVCEAQMVGLPVIACNVGGVATLIEHEKTGFLVPSNGVFEVVHYLKLLFQNKEMAKKIGTAGRKIALERHQRDEVVHGLLNVYKSVIQMGKNI